MMSFHLLFMLIYLLPYKRSQYVTEVFMHLKKLLGDFEFSRLFEMILTDNGTEFSDPESIELSFINGERLSSVFYCDPNASWQKGSIEKNHEYIRYVLPKGSSFAGFTLCKFYALSLLLILSVHLCSQSRSLLAKADVDDFFIILFWLFGHKPLHASV